MRFQVKQKIFTFADQFTIKDEQDRDYYIVEGKVFSLGRKLRLHDLNGTELYYIEQKLMKLFAEYHLYQGGNVVATCKQKFSIFGSKFEIASNKGHFEIQGQPLNYNYQILNNGRVIATADKKFFSFSDTYGVDINDDQEYPFILSLIIVIDQVVHQNNNN